MNAAVEAEQRKAADASAADGLVAQLSRLRGLGLTTDNVLADGCSGINVGFGVDVSRRSIVYLPTP